MPNPAKFRTRKLNGEIREKQLAKNSTIDRELNNLKQFNSYIDPRCGLTFKLESITIEPNPSVWVSLRYVHSTANYGTRIKIFYILKTEAVKYGIKLEEQNKKRD
jgi:hypothetical protein